MRQVAGQRRGECTSGAVRRIRALAVRLENFLFLASASRKAEEIDRLLQKSGRDIFVIDGIIARRERIDFSALGLELLDDGSWKGSGVLGPEALPPGPFLDLLTDYGSPWAMEERTPASR